MAKVSSNTSPGSGLLIQLNSTLLVFNHSGIKYGE